MATSPTDDTEIKSRIASFINREKWLENSLYQLRQQIAVSKAPNPTASLLPDVAAVVTRQVLGVPYSGKYARKFTRMYLKASQTPQSAQSQLQEQDMAVRHESLINEVRAFLQSVSVRKRNLTEPNSHLLIQRVISAQGYAKLETRIRRTITALENVSNFPLTYNSDIKPLSSSAPQKSNLPKFPRIATMLTAITNCEPLLRQFIRTNLIKTYGNSWLNKIQEKFANRYGKWDSISRARGGKDVLDGMQFGDLIDALNQFGELRSKFADRHEANLALSVIQNERRILAHPLERYKQDISETEFGRTSLAIQTLERLLGA